MRSLRAEIRALREENTQLREALEVYTQGGPLPLQVPVPGAQGQGSVTVTPIAASQHHHGGYSQGGQGYEEGDEEEEEVGVRKVGGGGQGGGGGYARQASDAKDTGRGSAGGYAQRHVRSQHSGRRSDRSTPSKPSRSSSRQAPPHRSAHATPAKPQAPSPATRSPASAQAAHLPPKNEGIIRAGPAARLLLSARSEATDGSDLDRHHQEMRPPPRQQYSQVYNGPQWPPASSTPGGGRDSEAAWRLAEETRKREELEKQLEQYKQLPSIMQTYEEEVEQLRGALHDAYRSTDTMRDQYRASMMENTRYDPHRR